MAIPITPSQMEEYRAAARRQAAERQAQIEARRLRAWETARRAAAVLKKDFCASRVVVFGSLLYAGRFHLQSDIDLAVWDVQDYFRAVSHLLDLDPGIEFDLVAVEDARPAVMQAITAEGVDL